MAMTDAEIRAVSGELIRRIYVRPNKTAVMHLGHFIAAVQSIDTAMNATTNQIQNAYPATVLETAIAQNLPEPFKSTATVAEKTLALAVWAMKRGGII